MKARGIAACALAAAILFGAAAAHAEELPVPRLRVGGSVGAGPIVLPGVRTLFGVEAGGRIGVQASDAVGFYLHPTLGAGLGSVTMAVLGVGFVAEGTVRGVVAFGAGPELGYVITFDPAGPTGTVFGGRAHLAVYPGASIADHYPVGGAPSRLVNRASYSVRLDVLVLTGSLGAQPPSPQRRDSLMVLPTLAVGIDLY